MQHSTPEALILARAEAFRAGDFGFIYDSYLPESSFLRLFPDRAAYVAYATGTLAATFQIVDCRILRVQVREATAYVLFRQIVVHDGATAIVVEVGRCEQDAEKHWRYAAGLKLDLERLPAGLVTATWEELEQAGNGLWI